MKPRSKQFIIIFSLLTVFTFTSFPIDDQNVYAQAGKDQKTEKKEAEKADNILVTFVEIGASRCIPCKAMQPIMKAIEEEYRGQVKVVFHDVWTPQGKADGMKYNIRMIPTQVFLDKNGREYYRHEGYFPREEVVKVIQMQGVK